MNSFLKKLLILTTICSGLVYLPAQGLVIKLHGSANLPAAQSLLEQRIVVDSAGNGELSNIMTTLGGGATFGLDAGYMFNEHFGLSLGFQFLNGSKQEALVNNTPANNINAEAYTRQGQVTIGGIVSTGKQPLSVYTKFGALLPITGVTTLDLNFKSDIFGVDQTTKTENQGKFSLGFYGGLGVEYRLTDLISISGETVFNALTIKVMRAEIVEKVDNETGDDLLSTLEPANVVTEYLDELDQNSNNSSLNPDFDLDMPRNELSYTSNYSNVALRLGIGLHF